MNKNRIRQLAGLPTVRENYAMTNLATHQSPPATVSMGDEFRRIAGLPAIPSTSTGTPVIHPTQTQAPEPARPVSNLPPATPPAAPAGDKMDVTHEVVDEKDEDPTDNEKAEEEKPVFPEAVMKAAEEAEGKTGDELVAIIQHLYDKAVKDGKAAAEEIEEKGEE